MQDVQNNQQQLQVTISYFVNINKQQFLAKSILKYLILFFGENKKEVKRVKNWE